MKKRHKKGLKKRYGHSYAQLRAKYGHSFAEEIRKLGGKVHRVMQDHPDATAALTGASIGAVSGGFSAPAAIGLGAAAGLVGNEIVKKKKG
jgi:phosphoribosylformylglycinamidine (FGAM) synthase-like amidotransferase family enzyme